MLGKIKKVRKELKEILRSAKASSFDALDEAITMVVNAITDEIALNWFNHRSKVRIADYTD